MLAQKHYSDAILVQDACNISGVVHSFVRVLELTESELAHRKGGDVLELNRHPLMVMYASKVLSLSKGELQARQDLRKLPGWHLKLFVKCLSGGLTTMRELEKTEGYGIRVDNKFLDGHTLTRWMAVKIAELTHCESLDVFGQAYDACKRVDAETEQEASHLISEDESLHRVMIPDTPEGVDEDEDEEEEIDWVCECQGHGLTQALDLKKGSDTPVCPFCGSDAITAVSASLRAELKTPKLLAQVLRQRLPDNVIDLDFTAKDEED